MYVAAFVMAQAVICILYRGLISPHSQAGSTLVLFTGTHHEFTLNTTLLHSTLPHPLFDMDWEIEAAYIRLLQGIKICGFASDGML